jgi:hypothetical protein
MRPPVSGVAAGDPHRQLTPAGGAAHRHAGAKRQTGVGGSEAGQVEAFDAGGASTLKFLPVTGCRSAHDLLFSLGLPRLDRVGNRLTRHAAATRLAARQQTGQRTCGAVVGNDQAAKPNRCAISSVATLWFML